MVIAALLTFSALLAAWIAAPAERHLRDAREPESVRLPDMADLPEAA